VTAKLIIVFNNWWIQKKVAFKNDWLLKKLIGSKKGKGY